MKKRFKSKKRLFARYKFGIFIILFGLSFYLSFNYLYNKTKKNLTQKDIIDYLILGKTNSSVENLLNMNSEEFLINYSLGVSLKDKVDEDLEIEELGDYMEDPAPSVINKPLIYIYNTHQTESYHKDIVASYNISPTVMLASYMLREKLNDLGIPTIVETKKVKDVLNQNNWVYKHSYKASRVLLEDAYKENPSLELFIDLHRDSSLYNKTTLKIDNKSYAKILFVVGLDYQGYEKNLNNANNLNKFISNEIPNLSRGVLKKSGKGVNGIYNQDFHNNTFLIEVGGQYNNIDEVKNTIEPLSKAIFNYVEEYYNEAKS